MSFTNVLKQDISFWSNNSVKQVSSLPVQVFCMCFVKHGAVLLKMPSMEIPKMIITSVHHIRGLIYFLYYFHSILKLNKMATIKKKKLARLADYLKSP